MSAVVVGADVVMIPGARTSVGVLVVVSVGDEV